jgi:hypothetical protein
MDELAKYCLEVISKHPKLASEVNDYFVLCNDEIEEGGSRQHEIELCIGSIKELIEENS